MSTTQIDRLARAFLGELRKEVTPRQYREICKRNAAEPNPHVCHSHDFCDANIAMLAAFLGEGIDAPADDAAYDEWSRVWDAAKDLMQAGVTA